MKLHRVINFSGSGNMIFGLEELGTQSVTGFLIFLPCVTVFVAASGPGTSSAHNRATAGFAGRNGTVSVGESGSHGCKSVDVGCFGLRITPQMTDPMIEVINGNEKNIRLFS